MLEDFGARAGCAWREADEADTNLKTVLQGLLSGQYVYPVRIVCFNASEGWSRDATSDIADALAQRAADRDDDVSAALQASSLPTPPGALMSGSRCRCGAFREGKPEGPAPQSERDHFIRCTICGRMLDMRDLGDVVDHLHGQEIEEEPVAH